MPKVDLDTIVVGVDASQYSEEAVDWAAHEAKRAGRRLLLVNVWHWSVGAVGSPMSLMGDADPYTAGRHILEQASRRVRAHGVPVLTWLAEGSPSTALTEMSTGAAMLVVGRHGHGRVRRSLIGSVSQACLQQASCPVVVVPLGAAAGGAAKPSYAASSPA